MIVSPLGEYGLRIEPYGRFTCSPWSGWSLAIVFESNHMGGLLARHGRVPHLPWTGSSLAIVFDSSHMDCHGRVGSLAMDGLVHLPWTAMDCHGLPWTAMDCHCIRFVVIILLNTGIFLSPISCFLTHF